MDIVFVQGLKVDTVIGIYDWEKKIRQDIVLDIEMSSDIAAAAKLIISIKPLTIKTSASALPVLFVSQNLNLLKPWLSESARSF